MVFGLDCLNIFSAFFQLFLQYVVFSFFIIFCVYWYWPTCKTKDVRELSSLIFLVRRLNFPSYGFKGISSEKQ